MKVYTYFRYQPKNRGQPEYASLSGILEIDIVQVTVPAGRQGALDGRGDVAIELWGDLLRPQPKPWMRFDHLPPYRPADGAVGVRIEILMRFECGGNPFLN